MEEEKKEKLLADIIPSTLTAEGKIDLTFSEDKLMELFPNPTGNIILIGCNHSEKFNENFADYINKKLSDRKKKKSTKKEKKKITKIKGSGNYFTSQITFEIEHNDRIYKIKLFKNGTFEIPGVKRPDMLDLKQPLTELSEFLSSSLNRQIKIDITNLNTHMRNYKTAVLMDDYLIKLDKLYDILQNERKNPIYIDYARKILEKYGESDIAEIMTLLQGWNVMKIVEINYNIERSSILFVKFLRAETKDDKKITVKITPNAKINYDSGTHEQEILEIHYWLENLFQNHKNDILVNINTIQNESESESGESIYDS